MDDNFFEDLKLNHIGIIIPVDKKKEIEAKSKELFIEDNIQEVSVCFVWDKTLNLYKEYITQEGRARNYRLGYNHICYDIASKDEMNILHKNIVKSRSGVRLTLPEPSPTKQCNLVTFYKIFSFGIFEFNILK